MNFLKRLSIKQEVFYFGLILSCLALTFFGVLFSINLFSYGIDSVKGFLRETNQSISIYTEGYFKEIINTIEVLSQNQDIRDAMTGEPGTKERALTLFNDFFQVNQNILHIYSGYEDGVLLINDYTPPEGFDPRVRPWYQAAMQIRPDTSTGVPYQEAVSREWVIAPSKALLDSQGEYSGVIAIDCSISSIIQLLGEGDLYKSQHNFVMDKRGKVIIHPNEEYLGERIPEILEKITQDKGDISYQIDKRGVWAYYHIIDSTGWIVVTAVDRSEVLFPIIGSILRNVLIVVGISVLLGFIQSKILGKRFANPLMELGSRISTITTGQSFIKDSTSYGYSNPEIVMIAENIEQLAIQSLGRKASELRTIIESTGDGILVMDDNNHLIYNNTRFREIWGIPHELLHDKDSHALIQGMVHQMEDPGPFLSTSKEITATDREELLTVNLKQGLFLECFSCPLVDDGQIVGRLWSFRDITERKRSEEKLQHLTFHDQVTGLYNRTFFEEELKRLEGDQSLPLSVIMADVNGLKLVNDSMGHQEGDRLLKNVAQILKSTINQGIIARCGGDEFVILLPNTSAVKAHFICQKIEATCERAEQDPIKPSVALGYATLESSSSGADINATLKQAEDHMYRHKMLSVKSSRSALVASLQETLQRNSHETDEHATNLQQLSIALGQRLGLSDQELHDLSIIALLHDIGKVAISETILNKEGALSPEEWKMMKGHPEIGYRIANASPDLKGVAEEILSHHERWDGKGYPRGLKGEEIPLAARIVFLVDSYDSMINERPFRKALNERQALGEIEKGIGSFFDPKLVKEFLKMMGKE